MLIKFSTDQHEDWVEGFDNWLREQGLDPEDKKGRYGYAKLGTVVGVDLDFVQEEISGKYDDIDRIIVIDKEEHLDHKFPYSRHDDDYETKFLGYLHD